MVGLGEAHEEIVDTFAAVRDHGVKVLVAAGPLVRPSYHADQHVPQAQAGVGPLAR